MKFAVATALLASLPAAFSFQKTSQGAIRRLADQADDYEFSFLKYYEQVYMTCDPSKEFFNDKGEIEYGAVVYRLCPSGAACGKDGQKVCDSGSGDYVVSLQTYMQQYLQQFRRNQDQNNEQNQFNFADFGECKEYKIEGGEEGTRYYLGPLCTEEGNIRIAFFKSNDYDNGEEQCIQQNLSDDFETLTGLELPWSNSIFQEDDCKAYYCSSTDENGNVEFNDFCLQLFQESTMKCESKMQYFSAAGKSIDDCQAISAMLPASSTGGKAGVIIIVVLLAVVAAFGAWYFMSLKKQQKSSSASSEGLMM